ncbi:hypothetical protein NL108_007737, partial [Boleophthalmus pectinirostris]
PHMTNKLTVASVLAVLGSGGYIVVTEAQAGPLYRVEGSELSISCSVTGLPPLPDGRNDFEFRVKKPAKPDFELNIISTNDEYFPFSLYGDRVRSGEIAVIHKDPNSVVFKILHLQKADEGEYDCSVVNTRSTYNGIYSALTTVKVIDNSLSISSSSPASMAQTEGDSLELTCEASTNTIQHTHLSVGFFLRENTKNASLVMSMDKDFVLIPGQDFEQRYKSGLIRLDKIGQVTYRLKISQLKLSDQGALYCEAQEWIQDPDQTWYSIATKASTETSLTVKAKDSESLAVTMSIPHSTLQEGQRLSVSCAVDSQNLKQKFFSLAWLRGGVELARVGPTGVLTVGPDYSSREREGELRAGRIGDRDYSLILQPVRTSDQGEFVCRAWPEERSSTGDFIQGAAQDSKPHAVNIALTVASLLKWPAVCNVNEGDKLVLSCRVSGATGQLSVIWQRAAQSAPFSSLVSLDEDGVMAKAEGSADVRVKALRPASDLFTLELEEATQAAAGRYQCEVSEWKTTNNKASSQVATSSVIVTPLGTVCFLSYEITLDLTLTAAPSIRANINADIELKCSVSSNSLVLSRYAVTWFLEDTSNKTGGHKMIVKSDQNAFVTFEPDLELNQRKRLSVSRRAEGPEFVLSIRNTRSSDRGVYMCEVVQWQQDPSREWHQLPPVSKSTQLSVIEPGHDLHLNTTTPVLTVEEGDDVELECNLVSAVDSPSVFYKVIWLYSEANEPIRQVPLVELDHTGLLSYPVDEAVRALQGRLRLLRPAQTSFNLGIHKAHEQDSGTYICRVEQYQLDRDGQWQQKASDETSPMTLNV